MNTDLRPKLLLTDREGIERLKITGNKESNNRNGSHVLVAVFCFRCFRFITVITASAKSGRTEGTIPEEAPNRGGMRQVPDIGAGHLYSDNSRRPVLAESVGSRVNNGGINRAQPRPIIIKPPSET